MNKFLSLSIGLVAFSGVALAKDCVLRAYSEGSLATTYSCDGQPSKKLVIGPSGVFDVALSKCLSEIKKEEKVKLVNCNVNVGTVFGTNASAYCVFSDD